MAPAFHKDDTPTEEPISETEFMAIVERVILERGTMECMAGFMAALKEIAERPCFHARPNAGPCDACLARIVYATGKDFVDGLNASIEKAAAHNHGWSSDPYDQEPPPKDKWS